MIELLRDTDADFGLSVKIKKEIPLGSGMGGSAASAVAGIVAANALLKKPLNKDQLFRYALMGEKVATGSIHGDNVAPCLFGGLTLVQSIEPVRVVDIPTPKNLYVVIAIPNARLDTKEARRILKREIPLESFVSAADANTAHRPSDWPSIPWRGLATEIYFAGMLLLLTRFVIGLFFSRRLVRASRTIHDYRVRMRVASRAYGCGLDSVPRACECELISVPPAAALTTVNVVA